MYIVDGIRKGIENVIGELVIRLFCLEKSEVVETTFMQLNGRLSLVVLMRSR